MELAQSSIVYRSKLVFTPIRGDQIDEFAMAGHVDRWIRESGVDPSRITSGGVIVTGLAAQRANVAAIEALVRQRVGETLFATADDPRLESWLAFMGSCVGLSRAQPNRYILNLDVGGGTTNLALGRGSEVIRTGCLFAGARHFQFVPGSYRIVALSSYAGRLLHDLGVNQSIDGSLSPDERSRVLDFYVALIEAAVLGDRSRLDRDPFRYHEQVPYELPTDPISPVITFSGGVGELIYARTRGEPLPATTAFGDLGIDLARRLVESPVLSRHLRTHTPVNSGHATAFGLSLYGTAVSGATLYLPDTGVLPARDLPIVAKLRMDASADDVRRAVDLAGCGARGGCIEVDEMVTDYAEVKKLGTSLATALREAAFPADRSLVIFVPHNIGKTLGSYATDWGRLPVNLIVIDELATRNSRFASLGALRDNVVPVSFYGMQ
jgi:ethanolamine utilization protein EutA